MWMLLLPLSASVFAFSRRTGPVPQTPATAVSRTGRETRHRPIYCRRAKRLRCDDAVPCGLASVTSPRSPSCGAAGLLAPRLDVWDWCPLEHRWRRRQSPVPLLRSGRDLPPSLSKTSLPCDPRFFELPTAPLPFLKLFPVRPGDVKENTGCGSCNARSPPRSAAAAIAPPA